jgi:hypothetical protein
VDIAWEQFVLAAWQGNSTTPFDPSQAMGLAFSFDPETNGWLRVDDISLLSIDSAAPPPEESPTRSPAAEAPTQAPTAEVVTEPTSEESATQTAATEPPTGTSPTEEAQAEQPAAESEPEEDNGGLCPGSAAIAMLALTGVLWTQKGRRQ